MEQLSYREEKEKWDAVGTAHQDAIRAAKRELSLSASGYRGRFVIFDDDPTGVQTVHDLPVYTDWRRETFEGAFAAGDPVFYILTNSRGLKREETRKLHREAVRNCALAAGDIPFQIVSRSDSTLRGHYPLETDTIDRALADAGRGPADGVILAPFFAAGGRFTIGHVHYVRYGDRLVPASETEFARDETFGYTHSSLTEYIAEKTAGRWKPEEVRTVELGLLRRGDVEAVTKRLMELAGGVPLAVDALLPDDMCVFCAALYRALAAGKHFLYRTAADFVRAVGAIPERALLTGEELLGARSAGNTAGLVIVGSHTEKTTRQLELLRKLPELDFIEFAAHRVLDGTLEQETARVRARMDDDLARGVTPVVYTERQVVCSGRDMQTEETGACQGAEDGCSVPDTAAVRREEALSRSVAISDALCKTAVGLRHPPAWIIAKGGITSSDMGVRTLGVKRAWVLGQVRPGIPVWRTDGESRYPDIPYVIFPGNVGEEEDLERIVRLLAEQKRREQSC